MLPKTHRECSGDPTPEVTITKALRIGAEEIGVLLRKGYKSNYAKLSCCIATPSPDDDNDDRQRLLNASQRKHTTPYVTNRNQGPDRKSRTGRGSRSSSSQEQEDSSIESATTRSPQQNDEADENDNEVPPEFQVLSSTTPPTPVSWNLPRSKILVGGNIANKDQAMSAKFKPECWPPSYPGIERNNFGARFYDSFKERDWA